MMPKMICPNCEGDRVIIQEVWIDNLPYIIVEFYCKDCEYRFDETFENQRQYS